MAGRDLMALGVILIVLGILAVFLGLAANISSREEGQGSIRGGGVVMIGPIPLIFGTDRESASVVIILAIILVLFSYLLLRGR